MGVALIISISGSVSAGFLGSSSSASFGSAPSAFSSASRSFSPSGGAGAYGYNVPAQNYQSPAPAPRFSPTSSAPTSSAPAYGAPAYGASAGYGTPATPPNSPVGMSVLTDSDYDGTPDDYDTNSDSDYDGTVDAYDLDPTNGSVGGVGSAPAQPRFAPQPAYTPPTSYASQPAYTNSSSFAPQNTPAAPQYPTPYVSSAFSTPFFSDQLKSKEIKPDFEKPRIDQYSTYGKYGTESKGQFGAPAQTQNYQSGQGYGQAQNPSYTSNFNEPTASNNSQNYSSYASTPRW